MEDFDFENGGELTINYAEVTKSKDLLAVTRLLAADLIARPYMVVGDYMKSLSDSDLQMLVDISDDEKNRLIEIANKCPIHKALAGDIQIKTQLVS